MRKKGLRRHRTWAIADPRDDSGSSLIIALFFIIVVAVAITALMTFAGGALLNTANLRTQRSREYAADTGTDIAIQKVRYSSTGYNTILGTPITPPTKCFGPATLSTSGPHTHTATSNKRTVVVYCRGKRVLALPHQSKQTVAHIAAGATTVATSTLFAGSTTRYVGFKLVDSLNKAFPTTDTAVIEKEHATGKVTLSAPAKMSETHDTLIVTPIFERTVTFFACVAKGTTTPPCPYLSTPAKKPNYLIHALVAFDDVTSNKDLCGAPHTGTPTCGTAMSVEQWVVETANG